MAQSKKNKSTCLTSDDIGMIRDCMDTNMEALRDGIDFVDSSEEKQEYKQEMKDIKVFVKKIKKMKC